MISSTKCLCRSTTVTPLFASSSALLPRQIVLPQDSQRQMGMGFPQYRLREIAQSLAPFEPVAEASVPDVRGDPEDLPVGRDHALLDLADIHEPGGNGPVDERALAAPAVRVGVKILVALDELTLRLQPRDDVLVRLLHEAAGVVRNLLREPAFAVDWTDNGDSGAFEGVVVVLAESGSRMDDTAAVLRRHVVGCEHLEGPFFNETREIGEQRLVPHTDQITAFHLPNDPVVRFLLVVPGKAFLREDVVLVSVTHLHVADVRSYGESEVGGKGPWRGRPREEKGVLLPDHPEFHRDCRIMDIHVSAQVEFVVGENGRAAGAVRRMY